MNGRTTWVWVALIHNTSLVQNELNSPHRPIKTCLKSADLKTSTSISADAEITRVSGESDQNH